MSRNYGLLIVALLAIACVSPADRFEEFENRVIDSGNTRIDGRELGEIPDITGEFLFALDPVPIAPGVFFEYIAAVELTPQASGATANFSIQPLNATTREPVGAALLSNDVTINTAGEFSAPIMGMVDGLSNPISGQALTFDLAIEGIIISADLFCGDITGAVTQPFAQPLEGTTFGAIRITPGTTGAALPESVATCPEVVPDAGVPDAGPVFDAGPMFDAALPDAA